MELNIFLIVELFFHKHVQFDSISQTSNNQCKILSQRLAGRGGGGSPHRVFPARVQNHARNPKGFSEGGFPGIKWRYTLHLHLPDRGNSA